MPYSSLMLDKLESKIVLIALLFLIPTTAALATHIILQIQESKSFSNSINGYIPPKWLGFNIDKVQESLVTVNCNESLGSGFSFGFDDADRQNGFDFDAEEVDTGSSIIITNAHVVENCMNQSVKIVVPDKSTHLAKVMKVDSENDLAMLISKVKIEPLYGAYAIPREGFWVMALGSPHSFAGSVTFGNIINRDEKLIFTTASLSPGNSGGPLIDNEGYVFGVNTGSKPVGQNFNISVGVNTLCAKLIVCPESRFWAEEQETE